MQEMEQVTEGGDTNGTVTISFSVSLPDDGLATKAFGEDWRTDIKSLHLVVFDENGYFIAVHEAQLEGTQYKVTLHKTDKKRVIHFIANCPVEQIQYGHESNVISNLYSIKGTDSEVAYWHRIEVWYILADSQGKLDPLIADAFKDVTLLRNYASINVVDNVDDFVLEGYAIYNTINVGTIAPFNVAQHKFQKFTDQAGDNFTYQELTYDEKYYGHALSRVSLNSTLTDLDFMDPRYPTYMYERKISARTEDEDKWHESPAHIVLKGKYGGSSATSYYKVDMIDDNHTYYNILRNFKYTFIINSVAGSGYASLQEAMDNPAGNNLSGSTDTQGITNISDGVGRIFVSYTDTTLTSSAPIKLRFKYIPNISNYNVTANDVVDVQGILDGTGSVIQSAIVSADDATGSWEGWREIIIQPKNPGAITHVQEINLKVPENPNLNKNVRIRLQKSYVMTVECNPDKVGSAAGYPVTVNIGLPKNLTEDLFPLHLAIEVKDYSLSPDATVSGNDVIVEPGKSVIPESNNKNSYHFVKTIETYQDYLNIPEKDNKKYVQTYWLTNKKNSASTVYVYNKYFDIASDIFINAKAFTDVDFPDGIKAEQNVATRFVFNMETVEPVTVKLEGLRNASGQTEFTYNPTNTGQQTLTLYTLNTEGTVKVTLEAESYSPYVLEREQVKDITIATLVVRFTRNRINSTTTVNNIPANIVFDGINIKQVGSRTISQANSGGNRYTYTTTFTNVVIADPDLSSTVTISYRYNNNTTYKASVKLQDLINNPTVELK